MARLLSIKVYVQYTRYEVWGHTAATENTEESPRLQSWEEVKRTNETRGVVTWVSVARRIRRSSRRATSPVGRYGPHWGAMTCGVGSKTRGRGIPRPRPSVDLPLWTHSRRPTVVMLPLETRSVGVSAVRLGGCVFALARQPVVNLAPDIPGVGVLNCIAVECDGCRYAWLNLPPVRCVVVATPATDGGRSAVSNGCRGLSRGHQRGGSVSPVRWPRRRW